MPRKRKRNHEREAAQKREAYWLDPEGSRERTRESKRRQREAEHPDAEEELPVSAVVPGVRVDVAEDNGSGNDILAKEENPFPIGSNGEEGACGTNGDSNHRSGADLLTNLVGVVERLEGVINPIVVSKAIERGCSRGIADYSSLSVDPDSWVETLILVPGAGTVEVLARLMVVVGMILRVQRDEVIGRKVEVFRRQLYDRLDSSTSTAELEYWEEQEPVWLLLHALGAFLGADCRRGFDRKILGRELDRVSACFLPTFCGDDDDDDDETTDGDDD